MVGHLEYELARLQEDKARLQEDKVYLSRRILALEIENTRLNHLRNEPLEKAMAEVERLTSLNAEWSRQNLAIIALEVEARKRADKAEAKNAELERQLEIEQAAHKRAFDLACHHQDRADKAETEVRDPCKVVGWL